MKFDTKGRSSVQQVGNITKNSISIDSANIDFIVTLLSTNLYSQPVQSLIRETVSNAWDSHVEANVTDPVLIELGKDSEDNYYFSVEDFGVGISEDRFNRIFRNVGSSSKRHTNDLIGGFGIGRFSVLAYSNVAYLTSHYDGVKYQYIMYKDSNKVSIDLLHSEDTQQRNGFKVYVPIKQYNDLYSFKEAITSQLLYFENAYFIDKTNEYRTAEFAEEFNGLKIKRYKNFSVNTLYRSRIVNLTLGKVAYPIRFNALNKKYSYSLREYPITLRFSIGDLEVTPNREEILYSDHNIKAIEDKMDAALEEIEGLIAAQGHDYTDFQEYYKNLSNHTFILLEEGENTISIKNSVRASKMTFKGKKYQSQLLQNLYRSMVNANLLLGYRLKSGKFLSRGNQLTTVNDIFHNPGAYFIADVAKLTAVEKAYVKDTVPEQAYFFTPKEEYWKGRLQKLMQRARMNTRHSYSWKETKLILTEMIIPTLKQMPRFNPKLIPQSWKDKRKAEQKLRRSAIKRKTFSKEEFTVHKMRRAAYSHEIVTDSITTTMEKIAKGGGIIVYGVKGDEYLDNMYTTVKYSRHNPKITFVRMAPTRMKKLDSISNCIKVKDFMSTKYKPLRRIATAMLIEEELPFLKDLSDVQNIDQISTKVHDAVRKLRDYVVEHSAPKDKGLAKEIFKMCQDHNYFDEEIRSFLRVHKELLTKAQILILFKGQLQSSGYGYGSNNKIPKERLNLATDYILARKLFRPSMPAFYKLKKETVLNLKPEEHED